MLTYETYEIQLVDHVVPATLNYNHVYRLISSSLIMARASMYNGTRKARILMSCGTPKVDK